VREAEQRHLSRELHDQIGQLLTGLRLALATGSPDADTLDRAHALADDIQARVRALSLDLRPPALDDLGLLPALRDHLRRYAEQTGVRPELRQAGLDRRLPPAVETAAFRIVQEALTNVARHAGTAATTVQLVADDGWLTVQVRDEGRGFDPDAALAARASAGLMGMRERATLLDGTLTIDAAPGAGTVVTAELPLVEPASLAASGEREGQ
jgi:signal transduction histidine kinase